MAMEIGASLAVVVVVMGGASSSSFSSSLYVALRTSIVAKVFGAKLSKSINLKLNHMILFFENNIAISEQ